jgi:hypothetical protein
MSILDEKHSDWPWLLSRIPRKWTAVRSERKPCGLYCIRFSSTPRRLLLGLGFFNRTDTGAYDVPEPREAVLAFSRFGFMFSFQTAKGWLFRIGSARYDYVDKYYTMPTLTLKKKTIA